MKISFDFDKCLATAKGQELAKKLISEGNTLYIISARNTKSGMIDISNKVGIPISRVFATGSNSNKVKKVKELEIKVHYDDNSDVIKDLGSIGKLFK